MNKELFWKMIEAARKKSGKNLGVMHDILLEDLLKLSAEDIFRWGDYYATYHMLANTEPMYMAAYVTNNRGDDSFEYFIGWLISRGHKAYINALADPDSLAKQRIKPGDELSFEDMMSLGYEAFVDKVNDMDEEPEGVPLTEQERAELHAELVFADTTGLGTEAAFKIQLPKRVPQLCKKFNYEGDTYEEDFIDHSPQSSFNSGYAPKQADNTGSYKEDNSENKRAYYETGNEQVMLSLPNAADIDLLSISTSQYLNNLDSLADFTKLTILSFSAFEASFEQLSDFSVLKKLTKLESLNMSNMPQLKNLDFVRSMPNLKRLCVSTTVELDDISAVEGLAHLETLIIHDCPKITAIPSLSASATSLKTVRFMNNKLESIEGLKGLQCVADLGLEHNKLEDISPLATCPCIKQLDLSRNKISNVAALSHLSEMGTLNLSHNKIEDISPLSSLRKLKNLFLSSNKLTDISALSNLQEIFYTLDLTKNKKLADISPLKGVSVGGVSLKGTAVTDFSPVVDTWYVDKRDS